MSLPLTPSDHPDYQRNNPIKPDDEFIVMIDGDFEKSGGEKLTEVFNRHGKGRITSALNGTFWCKYMSWPIINELRNRDDVSACGPVAKSKGPYNPFL